MPKAHWASLSSQAFPFPLTNTGNATTHECVCVSVSAGDSLGHPLWSGRGRKGEWLGQTTMRDNKRPRLTLELRSYCHLLLLFVHWEEYQ